MPQTITIIRHAETEYNQTETAQGHIDCKLNLQGRHQADAVAVRLKNDPIDIIYTSDLSRASDTAIAIHSQHQAKLKKSRLIREKYLGQLEGLNKTERKNLANKMGYTGEYCEWHQDFVTSMGVESKDKVTQRIKQFWHKLKKHHSNQHVILVTHGGVIITLVEIITKKPVKLDTWFGNTSVTRLEKTADPFHYDIQYINDISHLQV